jgi:hypothetical protein
VRRRDNTSDTALGIVKRGYTYAEAIDYLGLKRRAFEKHIRPRLPPPTPCDTARVFERPRPRLGGVPHLAKLRTRREVREPQWADRQCDYDC